MPCEPAPLPNPNDSDVFVAQADRHRPTLANWPLQNNRTGWKPVSLPIILVVPHRRTVAGTGFNDSAIFDLEFVIEDAPEQSKVAGIEHKGILVPQTAIFVRAISTLELSAAIIQPEGQVYTDAEGNILDKTIGAEGDFLQYTLLRGWGNATARGAVARIPFFPDADYFDLSEFTLETGEALPRDNYKFVWQLKYFKRVISPDDELVCIDNTTEETERFALKVKHPGDVHGAMIDHMPSVYFRSEANLKREDSANVAFIRPFADALQDIFDEQSFIDGINHVKAIPAEYIPYLSFLLGWDLPYFPGATDNIRTATLRSARALQGLKGSKQVLRELFEIFGFVIDIVNLWFRADGKALIAPGEELQDEFEDQEIQSVEVCQTDVLLSEFETDGFGDFEVPLLFRPDSDVTFAGFIVTVDSTADNFLQQLIDDGNIGPATLERAICSTSPDGSLIGPVELDTPSTGTVGFSRVLLKRDDLSTEEIQVGEPVLSGNTIKFDFDRSIAKFNFDHAIQFSSSTLLTTRRKAYVFVTYKRTKIVVPAVLSNLRSNRFDINILFKDGEIPDSQVLAFLIDFLFKLKAFHSLLRKIRFTAGLTGIYNALDFCVGGEVSQDPGTDAGELQVPPAIIPSDFECTDGLDRGFKDADFALRKAVLDGLCKEHEAWNNLDGTHDIPSNLSPLLESLSRVTIRNPDPSTSETCQFTRFGQDRVKAKIQTTPNQSTEETIVKDFDHIIDDRTKLCDLTDNQDDYCYKGRVEQQIDNTRIVDCTDAFKCKPCPLGLGQGLYWSTELVPGADDALFFADVEFFRSDLVETNDFLAARRPSLTIQKDNLHHPGHRFVEGLGDLESDFTSVEYNHRPWDFDTVCPGTKRDLNAALVSDPIVGTEESGLFIDNDLIDPGLIAEFSKNETLTFDLTPFSITANGITPDVSSLSTHDTVTDLFTNKDQFVTHSIFSTQAGVQASDSAVSLDVTFTELDSICLNGDLGPIFRSANRACACPSDAFVPNIGTDADLTTQAVDFIDGYSAEFGTFTYNPSTFSYSDGTRPDLTIALELPTATGSATGTYRLGSGILVPENDPRFEQYKAFRLDCECLFFECDDGTTGAEQNLIERCHIELFRDSSGVLDPDCDQVTSTPTMVLSEPFGTCSTAVDGTIPNLMCFDADKINLSFFEKLPTTGSYFFIDSFGVIYEVSFETADNKIDITTTTKDPRVWGEPAQGFVTEDKKVFRRGVISTTRQIIQLDSDNITIISSGFEQKIDFFQTTFGCGDSPLPNDPFAFHVNCGISDDLEIVTSGTGS